MVTHLFLRDFSQRTSTWNENVTGRSKSLIDTFLSQDQLGYFFFSFAVEEECFGGVDTRTKDKVPLKVEASFSDRWRILFVEKCRETVREGQGKRDNNTASDSDRQPFVFLAAADIDIQTEE